MTCQLSSDEDRKSKTIYTYDEAVELTGHGLYNQLLLVACSLITCAAALDMFGFSIIVAIAKCDLNLGLTEMGMLASAPFTGILFAYPWGYFADTRGRRRALLFSTLIGFVFAAITSLAASWQFMMFFKIVASCFSNASFSLTMTLIGECVCAAHRGKYLFIMNSLNLVSEGVSFGLAYFLLPIEFRIPIPMLGIDFRPWRLLTLALALPLGIGGLMMLYLHESPKFLASRGDNKKSLEVLRSIYERNGGKKEDYPVHHLITTDDVEHKTSFWESVVKQTVPIFKTPLLWRTLQLFYIMAICCSTNNAFVMWYPMIVNLYYTSFTGGWNSEKKFCTRVFGNSTVTTHSSVDLATNNVCIDTLSDFTIISGILYGLLFCMAALTVSKFATHSRLVLTSCLVISGVSGTLVDLYQPAASLVFFVLLQTSAIGIPSVVAYCVDLYPTAYRGMMTSLSMMVARMFSLAGVNLVGAVITTNCALTFYAWSVFVFSGVVAAFFLPSDRKNTSAK